jgi:hypothetical protein
LRREDLASIKSSSPRRIFGFPQKSIARILGTRAKVQDALMQTVKTNYPTLLELKEPLSYSTNLDYVRHRCGILLSSVNSSSSLQKQ